MRLNAGNKVFFVGLKFETRNFKYLKLQGRF